MNYVLRKDSFPPSDSYPLQNGPLYADSSGSRHNLYSDDYAGTNLLQSFSVRNSLLQTEMTIAFFKFLIGIGPDWFGPVICGTESWHIYFLQPISPSLSNPLGLQHPAFPNTNCVSNNLIRGDFLIYHTLDFLIICVIRSLKRRFKSHYEIIKDMYTISFPSQPPKPHPRYTTQSSPGLAIITTLSVISPNRKTKPTNGHPPIPPHRPRLHPIYRANRDHLHHQPHCTILFLLESESPLYIVNILTTPLQSMEDTLPTLWNSLTLTDSETTTIVIDQSILSTPENAIVGRLAMKRFVSHFDIEKSMRSFWEIRGAMETTRLGDNIFMFVFDDKMICNRII